jgi:hypothetical protein
MSMPIFGLTLKPKKTEPEIDPVLEAAIKARLAERVRTIDRTRRPIKASFIRESTRECDRARVYRVGSAMFSPDHETSCRIVDQSFSGLRLAFNGVTECPDEFALTIPTLRFIGIVRKVWQNNAEVGVSILRWNDAV